MSVTINVICYRNKKLSNGESSIMIRVCNKAKSKTIAKEKMLEKVMQQQYILSFGNQETEEMNRKTVI